MIKTTVTTYNLNGFGCATGTSAFGFFYYFFYSGVTTNTTNSSYIYTYSSDAIAASSVTLFNEYIVNGSSMAACGNSVMGVFFNTITNAYPNPVTNVSSIYYYANNSTSTGMAIGSMSQGCGTGNDIMGVISLGMWNVNTNIYMYSSNMVYVGTNLNHTSIGGSGTSNYNPGVNT